MDKPCGRNAAGPMIAVSVAIRLIWHFTVDDATIYNAAWLCPLIGFVLYLPIGISFKLLSKSSEGCALNARLLREKPVIAWIFAICTFVLLAFDASTNAHLLSNTANVMALGEVPMWLVALPVTLLAFVCALFGMEACGRSARIWIWVMLPLLAIMMIVQFDNYRTEWLKPLLGGGIRAILNGSFRSAGYISLLSLPWLICTEDRCHKSVAFYAMFGSLAASGALALLSMLSPALLHTSLERSARIELILSNGRVHLMLQLLTVVLWLFNLLHLLNAECSSAAAILKNASRNIPNWVLAAVAAIFIYVCAATGIAVSSSLSSVFSMLLYPFLCMLSLILILLSTIKARR